MRGRKEMMGYEREEIKWMDLNDERWD